MIHRRVDDWENAYANSANIARGDTYVAKWADNASVYRDAMTKEGRVRLDLAYADAPRNRFDLACQRIDTLVEPEPVLVEPDQGRLHARRDLVLAFVAHIRLAPKSKTGRNAFPHRKGAGPTRNSS